MADIKHAFSRFSTHVDNMDTVHGFLFRAIPVLIFLLLALACCCCLCKVRCCRYRNERLQEEDGKWSMQCAEESFRKYPSRDNMCSGAGFRFWPDEFAAFRELILDTAADDLDFLVRVADADLTWSTFKYMSEGGETIEKFGLLRKDPDDAKFREMFKLQNASDLGHGREPTLLVKADDGLKPGLYDIVKPVWPTRTAELEVKGHAHHCDGRQLKATADVKKQEREEMFSIGDVVYLYSFAHVGYIGRTAAGEEEEGTKRVALRGQLSNNAWITMQSADDLYVNKHSSFAAFDTAERSTKNLPWGRRLLWYFWMLLGRPCHVLLHITFALLFLMMGLLAFIPLEVDKNALLISTLVLLCGIILFTLLYFLRQFCFQYPLSAMLLMWQSAREDVLDVKGALVSVMNVRRKFTDHASAAQHTVMDGVEHARDVVEDNFLAIKRGASAAIGGTAAVAV